MKRIAALLLLFLTIPLAALAGDIPTMELSRLKAVLEENRCKVIMLNFFATWCPPCRAEIPEIVKLREEFPESKLLIVGLSVDEKSSAVVPFLNKLRVNYPVYMAARSTTDAFQVSSVPHNAFIAPDGRVVVSEPGMAELPVLKQLVSDLAR